MRIPRESGFILYLTLAAACWGVGTVMSKGVLPHVPPLTLLVVQLGSSLTFLWTAVLVQRIPLLFQRETIRLGFAGLLNPGLAYTFGLVGTNRILNSATFYIPKGFKKKYPTVVSI